MEKPRSSSSNPSQQFVSFLLADEEYAIEILAVQEVIRPTPITKTPQAPTFVEGVINLRGKILPVIDLRAKFGLKKKEPDQATRIIVAELGDRVFGMIVDEVFEVLSLSEDQIEPPPPIVANVRSKYVRGIGKLEGRLAILLDLDKALSDEELQTLESMAGRD